MKNALAILVLLLLCHSGQFAQVISPVEKEAKSFPVTVSNENNGEEDGPDEYLGEIRERWQKQIHRAAPGVNWKQLEHENMLRKYNRVLSASAEGRKEAFANGRICGIWSERGSINQSGCIQAGDYDSSDNKLYAMGCNGNLFQGFADRCDWTPVNDNLKFSNQIIKVTKNASGGKRILCNLDLNIYYSDDNGQTFLPATGINFPVPWVGNKFVQMESLDDSARTLLLITRPWDDVSWSARFFLYVSKDHGQSWTKTFKFPFGDDYMIQIWVPAGQKDFSYILLNEDSANVSRLYKYNRQPSAVSLLNTSVDLPVNAYMQFAGNVSGSGTVLYAIANYNLYKSQNLGINWTKLNAAPSGLGVLDVSASDPNKVLVGGVEAYRTADGGNTWTKANGWGEYYANPQSKIHADIRKIKFYRQKNGAEFVIINCDGGCYRSDDYLVSANNISLLGLNAGQYYDGIADDRGRLFLGSQDQGFQRADSTITRTGPLAFQQVLSGDYGNLQLTRNLQTLWSQYPGGNMYYCYNSMGPVNQSWALPGTTKPLCGWMLATAPVYPISKNEILLGGGNINGGAGSYVVHLTGTSNAISASQINYDFRGSSNYGIAAIGTTPTDSNRIYVATEDGRFYYSGNAGGSWTRTSGFSGPTPLYLFGTCILTSKKTKNLLWYAGSGYSNPGVYKSTNGGFSFSPMANGLPSTLVYRIAANTDESLLFAATEAGPYVYVTADDLWYPLDNGLAPAQNYWAVQFDSAANTVHFSTYGRGLWDFLIGTDSAALTISASETTICSGTSVRFTAHPYNGGVSPTYRWKLNGNLVGGNSTTFSSSSLANGDHVSCEMTSGFDCSPSGSVAVSNTISMNVITSSIVPVAGSNSPACKGNSLYLTSSGGTGYYWTGPDGFVSNLQNPVISNITSTNAGIYTVRVSVSGGCQGDTAILVWVDYPPALPGAISVSGGSAAVCPGDVRTYSVPAVSGITYNWIPPAGAVINSGQGSNSIVLSISSAFTSSGYLKVTGNNSCGSGSARSLQIVRNNPAVPGAISVTGGTAAVCPGDTRTYTVPRVNDIIYTWTNPKGSVILSGQGTNSIVLTFTSNFTANGTLSVKASNNCGTSSARSLTIKRNLPATPGAISGPTSVCAGSITTYSVAPVSNANQYVWTVPAGASIQGVANSNSVNILWGNSGGYVKVQSKNNCGISSARSLSVSVASCPQSTLAKNTVRLAEIFPNPSHGLVSIRFHESSEKPCRIELFDATGAIVMMQNLDHIRKNENYPFRLETLPKGLYILNISHPTGRFQSYKLTLD